MPKQTVNKKPATTKKPVAKPKVTKKPTTKPRAKTTAKPRAKVKPAPKPVVVVDIEAEFPYDEFAWKLIYKDRTEKRTCYFQCEEHRKKHIARYKLTKKDILFIGYKFDE